MSGDWTCSQCGETGHEATAKGAARALDAHWYAKHREDDEC